MSTTSLVAALKAADQDHEFYPTTDEIIRALVRDLEQIKDAHQYRRAFESVLDIGAGTGKVLLALKEQCGLTSLHAIEKSPILCRQLPENILIVGTHFEEQSLLSKAVDLIYCNPPYSAFVPWTEKIIREAAAKVVYLTIPVRWESQVSIQDALKFREAEVKVVGKFSFEDAEDRTARAQVHLLRIELSEATDDAFERFFKEQFATLINKFETAEAAERPAEGEEPRGGGRLRPFHKLVVGSNYPDALVTLYQQEMAHIHKNYQLVGELDVDLLREFDISPTRIMACLKARMTGLRNDYWHELFAHLNSVTDRLTAQSRKNLLNTLHRHVQVDFTSDNIYQIVLWVLKNANLYIDSQLIVTYELMVAKCNVQLYQSNQRTWVEERWRYNGDEEKNSHYALDYRIVTHRIGGIRRGYSYERGLNDSAAEFLGDLLTIARNLGFNCDTQQGNLDRRGREHWQSGEKREFYFMDRHTSGRELLFDVRAFLNGNLHLRLHKSFILALNVEHGRLKGWLKTGKQAAEELRDPEAAQYFRSNLQLAAGDVPLMLGAGQAGTGMGGLGLGGTGDSTVVAGDSPATASPTSPDKPAISQANPEIGEQGNCSNSQTDLSCLTNQAPPTSEPAAVFPALPQSDATSRCPGWRRRTAAARTPVLI